MNSNSSLRLLCPVLLTLLSGCSWHRHAPDFTASGYLADRGDVRIWRKNSDPQTIHLLTSYSPFDGTASTDSDYIWQRGKLVSVTRHTRGAESDNVTLRFDSNGRMSFMQRQLAGRREPITADDIALYQYDAERMLKISDGLLSGRVALLQGSVQRDGTVTRCDGTMVRPDFDNSELATIRLHQTGSAATRWLAWLKAPGGVQLLKVSADNLCQSAPAEDDF